MTGYECEECTRIWPVQSAAETCAEQDLIEDRLAKVDPPRRDPNIIRSVN